jgi:Glycosyltransferase 61
VHFIPSGFTSRLTHDKQCVDPVVMDDFVQFVVSQYGLEHVTAIPGRISMVHPRRSISTTSDSTKTKAREINNLDEVTMVPTRTVSLGAAAANAARGQRVNSHFLPLYMSFYDQLRASRESQVLIGNHGAGLTHFIFMNDQNVGTAANEHANTPSSPPLPLHNIEFRGPGYDTFRNMMAWKPRVHYQQLPTVEYNMSRLYFDQVLRPVSDDILFLQNTQS